jgi:hypothetical protein
VRTAATATATATAAAGQRVYTALPATTKPVMLATKPKWTSLLQLMPASGMRLRGGCEQLSQQISPVRVLKSAKSPKISKLVSRSDKVRRVTKDANSRSEDEVHLTRGRKGMRKSAERRKPSGPCEGETSKMQQANHAPEALPQLDSDRKAQLYTTQETTVVVSTLSADEALLCDAKDKSNVDGIVHATSLVKLRIGAFSIKPSAEDMATDLQQHIFVCVDCETTGVNASIHRIVEVAAIKFTLAAGVIDTYHTLVDPGDDVQALTGSLHVPCIYVCMYVCTRTYIPHLCKCAIIMCQAGP